MTAPSTKGSTQVQTCHNDRRDVEAACMVKEKHRFAQACSTPFTEPLLMTDFGCLSETPHADEVLQGTLVPADEVHSHAKKFIHQLQQPNPPLPTV